MQKILLLLGLALLLCAAIYGAFYLLAGRVTSRTLTNSQPGSAAVAAAGEAQAPYVTPLLTQDYTNDDFRFSLKMPADFKASVTPPDENGTKTIELQNSAGDGVQISITPFDENITDLTADRIQQDQPDLAITDAQPVQIGENDTGLAFKSDNQAFGGASREVWFVFRGNLYQISTYDRLDPLLRSIFATWKFL